MLKRMGKALVVVAVLSLAAAACGAGGTEGTQVSGKSGGSAIGSFNEPDALDPLLSTTTTSAEVDQRLFDLLVSYDYKTLKIIKNGAADDYKVSADAKTLTFKLRKGAKFHNDEPVTAESFVRALTRVVLKKNASELSYHLDGIKGFAAAQAGKSNKLPGVHQGKNELELVIELDKPNAEFLTRTGHTVFSPVPKDAVDNPKAYNEAPIGNGPYKMVGKWQHNVQVRVTRFKEYNGKQKGFLDNITWKIFAETETQFLEFKGGTVDTADVPPESFDEARSTYGDAFVDQPSAILTYLAFTSQKAPTNNKALRQAISMAIDRPAIIKAVFSGQRVPATSVIPPTTLGYRAGACRYCTFDKAQAKQLLAQAGGAPARKLTLAYNSDGPHAQWIAAVAAQLGTNLGVLTKITPKQPFGDYLKFIETPAFGSGLKRVGWAQDYPTPDNWLFPLFFSTSGDNHSGFKNPTFDSTVQKAQQTVDPAARLKLYQKAEDIVLDEMPIVPMWYGKSSTVYSADKFATFPIDIQYAAPVWELVSLKTVK